MDYFPLFCHLQGRRCLLVGAGDVAERKARLLLEAGAELWVGAPAFSPAFREWAQQKAITLLPGPFDPEWLTGCWLVVAATSDDAVNKQVAEAAETQQIFCNLVDAPQAASGIMPSLIDRSPLMVAVSSGGRAPVLARLLRERLEAILPQHLGQLAQRAGTLRDRVKKQFGSLNARRHFWERFFSSERLAQTLANGDSERAEQITDALFNADIASQGEVALVGAGPGDAGLLTLKGLQRIQQADVIVYDRLVSDEILNLVRRDAERIFVGKRAGHHCVPQDEINQLLCEQAQRGKRVVRLKGGDPFIFGRGGEELEALAQLQIPFSVVPGITAASGCAAYSGIPLTHRDHAQSVRLVTGHLQKTGTLAWQTLAAEQQTLVFYMGLAQAGEIQQQLIKHGMRRDMPVALVENGTSTRQRVVTGTLDELEALAGQVISPSLMIIGSVVSLRASLRWF
jgi:uroporphyrin-III C-methyltransferase/precorrin-2 dehydrogenase/sirohydrochlorin ferrochelatase